MQKYPLYEKAKKLLMQEYQTNYEIVKQSNYHRAYVNEKIKHSMQVSGAGNGIIANEPYFKDKSDDFIDIARTAILLHDIYRFQEVRILFETGQKIDHGLKGAEFLEKTKDFNDIRITLPVKHHGHMIEEMYQDESYQKLSPSLQEEVKHIAFAVRDADKIANWYLLALSWYDMRKVWLPSPDNFSSDQAKIDTTLWDYFINDKISPNKLRKTNGDTTVSILCWLFDINYDYSIKYSKKLRILEKWCHILEKLNIDSEKIEIIKQTMQKYTLKHFKTTL